jgi:transposase
MGSDWPFLPKLARRTDGRGRPWRENRGVLNGILWILRTGAPWADLSDRYPSYQTCHRRFQQWVRAGVLRGILEVLAQALHDEGYLDLQETFIDGSFAPAKQGGAGVGKTKRGEGLEDHGDRRSPRTQDGRPLRRYRRRWKIERLFAWFQNFRRLVVRYERYAENFLAMLHLDCCLILLRGL